MVERLLGVRGVKVPPGWVLKAVRIISEIAGEMVNGYSYAGKERLTAWVPRWQRSLPMK